MANSDKALKIDIEEITSRTVRINHKDYYDVNAGAIILDSFIIVIDTLQYPKQTQEFREALEEKYGLPIKYLFITHYHGDHHFGSVKFKDVEIFGSNELKRNMEMKIDTSWNQKSFDDWKESEPDLADTITEIEIILPHKGFDEKYVLFDNDLRVEFYVSGGHSSCSSVAYFPEQRVLFVGDEIASGFWIYMSDSTGSPERWIESFERLLELDIDIVVPGHGPIVDKEYIEEQLIFMKKLKERVLDALAQGKEIEDVNVPNYYEPATDWQIPEALKFLFKYYSEN